MLFVNFVSFLNNVGVGAPMGIAKENEKITLLSHARYTSVPEVLTLLLLVVKVTFNALLWRLFKLFVVNLYVGDLAVCRLRSIKLF